MIKLSRIRKTNNNYDRATVTFEIDDNHLTLSDLTDELNNFIKAIGYCLDNRELVIRDTREDLEDEG